MKRSKMIRARFLGVAGLVVLSGCADEALQQSGPRALTSAPQVALDHLRLHAVDLGVRRIDDIQVRRTDNDSDAVSHVRVQERFKGVPVFLGEAIAHVRPDGVVASVTDNFVKGISETLSVVPSIGRDRAVARAVLAHGCESCLTAAPEADLMVLRHARADHLAWRVQLRREDGTDATSMPVYFVDAHDGALIWTYDNLQTGTGNSLYSGTVTVTTSSVGTTRYLEDLSRRMGTFDMRNTTAKVNRFTDANDVWDSSTQRAGVDAHYGAAVVYDYFLGVHGRQGIDGNGGPGSISAAASSTTSLIGSRVHYGRNYNNAFWNGSVMTYGDGDGTTRSAYVTLDIAGHEMTHGVTERSAGLIYSGESGALNESMSDVFGAMVERAARGETADTWKIGEQCYTPANGTGDAMRYMDDPHRASNRGYTADDDPDHYIERYTGTSDNGGVHINSGIGNKAFYLVAVGGTHHRGGSMAGVGSDAAARIWYRALTGYMTSGTNFAGARVATLAAAAQLYGVETPEYLAVASAWTLCGVN